MIKINDINDTIINGDLTYDQLHSIAMALKLARNNLAKKAIVELKVGDKVTFGVGGLVRSGVIVKIMTKNSIVSVSGVTYRVPSLILKSA
jgi:hypothetical protein